MSFLLIHEFVLLRSLESNSRWLLVTVRSRNAAVSWRLALVVGYAKIIESREWPVLLHVRYEKRHSWTDPSLHAALRRTLVDHDEFMKHIAVRSGSLGVVWQIPGFLCDYVQVDVMRLGVLGVAVTRHLLPVLLRKIEIHVPPATTTTAESTCACDVSASCTRNSTAGRGGDRSKGRGNCTAGTSHSTCRLRGRSSSSWTTVAAVAPEAEASRNTSRVRTDWEPSTVLELR